MGQARKRGTFKKRIKQSQAKVKGIVIDLFKNCINIDIFKDNLKKLSKTERRVAFEVIAYLSLLVNDIYGPKIYWPNQVRKEFDLVNKYKLDKILNGDRTLGADAFILLKRLFAVEFKSHDHIEDLKSLKAGIIAIKEVALNKTKIEKKDRIVVHDFHDVSKNSVDFLDNWTYIHIDEIFDEYSYLDIKNFINTQKEPAKKPWDYFPDVLGENYHEKQLTRIANNIFRQEKTYGNTRGLIIKPTATFKGFDPILLYRKFFKKRWYDSKQKRKNPIIISVNPSLNILTGNVLKQVKDHIGTGENIKTIVDASNLTPDDDEKDINLLESMVHCAKNDNEFLDLVETDETLWINTTIHSYYTVERNLKRAGLTDIYMMFIDEVKHTVVGENSIRTRCLKDDMLNIKHRIGLDANIVTGDEFDKNLDKKDAKFSMRNTDLWREMYEQMKETKAYDLGWKRRTKIVLVPWLEEKLPLELSNILQKKKNGMVSVPGMKEVVPFTYIMNICSNIKARWLIRDIDFTLNSFSTKENANRHEKISEKLVPALVAALPNTKTKKNIKEKLKKLVTKSIYNFGKSSRAIQRAVDGIPKKYPNGAIVNQVKLLVEGWDPKGGWLDSWSFGDPSFSKTRIYQIGGRPARIGNDIFNPAKKISYCILPVLIQLDLGKELAINKMNKVIKLVAEQMEIGVDTIEDNMIILPYQNLTGPGGKRQPGEKDAIASMTAAEMLKVIVRYQKGYRYSPWTPIVDEMFDELQEYYKINANSENTKDTKKLYDRVLKNKKYKKFLSQFTKSHARLVLGEIRMGTYWMLSEEKQLEGKNAWRHYKKVVRPNIYVKRMEMVIQALRDFIAKGVDEESLSSPKMIYSNSVLSKIINKNNNTSFSNDAVGKIIEGKTLLKYDSELFYELKKEFDNLLVSYKKDVDKKKNDIISYWESEIKKLLNPVDTAAQSMIRKELNKKYGIINETRLARIIPQHIKKTYSELKKVKDLMIEKQLIKTASKILKNKKEHKTIEDLFVMTAMELKKRGINVSRTSSRAGKTVSKGRYVKTYDVNVYPISDVWLSKKLKYFRKKFNERPDWQNSESSKVLKILKDKGIKISRTKRILLKKGFDLTKTLQKTKIDRRVSSL